MITEVHVLHAHPENPEAFEADDHATLRPMWAKLSQAIREAKHEHNQNFHNQSDNSGDTWHMCRAYRPSPTRGPHYLSVTVM